MRGIHGGGPGGENMRLMQGCPGRPIKARGVHRAPDTETPVRGPGQPAKGENMQRSRGLGPRGESEESPTRLRAWSEARGKYIRLRPVSTHDPVARMAYGTEEETEAQLYGRP